MAVHYQFTGSTAVEVMAGIEEGIRTGALPAGTLLPPVRGLAVQLSVSPGTVAKAYQGLRQRGLVDTAGRHGTRVRPRPPVTPPRDALRPSVPTGVRDLTSGDPDRRQLPPLGPALAALAGGAGPAVGYLGGGTVPAFAEAARRRLLADGVPADTVAVTSGALDGIDRLLAAHLRPGDAVAVEDPGWANLLDLVSAAGLRTVGVPVDDEGPTVAGLRTALAEGARALVVTTRAHNPTGAAVTADRARDLRELLSGRDLLVIEDDHAAELADVPLNPLAGATRHWAFVRSVSKPYGPDLRLAAVAGDEVTLARLSGRQRAGAGWVSTLLQRLVLALWTDPGTARRVSAAGRSYGRRRDGLRRALADRAVPAYGRTGINVWIPVRDETRAVTALRDTGYAVAPGSLYRLSSGPGIRVTVSSLDEPDIPPLADAIARAVRADPPAGFSA